MVLQNFLSSLLLSWALVLGSDVAAFHPLLPARPGIMPAARVSAKPRLFMSGGFGSNRSEPSKGKAASTPAGDFAYQEMLIYFNAMQKDGVTSRTMDPAKRSELEGFVRTVLANRDGLRLQDIGQAILPKSEWKLMFSTSEAVLESLPNDATVFLNVRINEGLSSRTRAFLSNTFPIVFPDTGRAELGLHIEIFQKDDGVGFPHSKMQVHI